MLSRGTLPAGRNLNTLQNIVYSRNIIPEMQHSYCKITLLGHVESTGIECPFRRVREAHVPLNCKFLNEKWVSSAREFNTYRNLGLPAAQGCSKHCLGHHTIVEKSAYHNYRVCRHLPDFHTIKTSNTELNYCCDNLKV